MKRLVLASLLLAATAHADGIPFLDDHPGSLYATAGRIDGAVYGPNGAVAGVVVRVIGARFIALARTDDNGVFRVAGLEPALYPVEIEHAQPGQVIARIPPPQRPGEKPMYGITITEDYRICNGGPMPGRTFAEALKWNTATLPAVPPESVAPPKSRGHVDTSSTSIGVTLGPRELAH